MISLQELKGHLDPVGLMVSVNVPGYENIVTSAFDAQLADNVDFMTIAAYDYHGSWEPVTGLTAPMSNIVKLEYFIIIFHSFNLNALKPGSFNYFMIMSLTS